MRLCIVFLSGIAIGVISLLAGSWVSHGQSTLTVSNNESFPDQFLRQALSLGNPEDWSQQRKQELLRQAASRSQMNSVAASGLYWAEFQKTLTTEVDSGRPDPVAVLGQLIAFQEQLEAALVSAPSVFDFEHAWGTWQQVNDQIASSRVLLVSEIANDLAGLPKPAEIGSLVNVTADLQSLDTFLRTKQRDITALLAVTPPSELMPAPVLEVIGFAQKLQSRSVAAVGKAQADIDRHRQKLRDGAVKIDPAKSAERLPADGFCTVYLTQLEKLDSATQEADFSTWLKLRNMSTRSVEDPATSKTVDGVDDFAGTLASAERTASSTRQLSYNLWALREIYAAESVESWAGRLGQIDNGQLEPVVSALFASTYTRRLEEVRDPERRSIIVQSILSGPKVTLAAF